MGFIKNIQNEIRVIRERDPAIHSNMEVFLYPSFKVMLHYRVRIGCTRADIIFLPDGSPSAQSERPVSRYIPVRRSERIFL